MVRLNGYDPVTLLNVSVVVPSYRTPRLTEAAARSALNSRARQVIVVENGPDEPTRRLIDAIGDARLVFFESSANSGFGAAANRGCRLARTDAILVLNSDATLSGIAAETILDELTRWGGRAIVGPRLLGPDGSIQRSPGLLPRPLDLAVRTLGLHIVGRWLGGLPLLGHLLRQTSLAREYATAETATDPIDTSMVSGACFAIGREAFQELGGFDEHFFMYFEDADLCRRAAVAGMPIRYLPSAVVHHIGGASSSEDYHFGPLHARSMRQYLGKWYGPGGSALALVLLWLRAMSFSVAMRPRAGRAWRALWAAVRDEDPRR